jgi:oligopeptide transport system ATP-binding protein
MSVTVKSDSADTPLVRVRNLVKHFYQGGDLLGRNPRVVRAVDRVSFDLQRTRTLGVVGESGCGKTTMARCMLRLVEPTEGEVYFEDVNILDLSAKELRARRRDMQIVFQNPYSSLDPRMSVLRIIGEPLRTHTSLSQGKVRDRVVQLLEQMGLSASHLYRYPHEFSGGQLQRIAIARALALNPRFLVLDEPTAALDVSVQAQIVELLMDLQEQLDLTYLFISHNLTLVHHLSDSIAVLYLGKIVEHTTAQKIFTNPLHPYTQVLLSSTPALDIEFQQQRIILSGGVPDPADPPPGCVFHPRCPSASEKCNSVEPTLVDAGDGHLVSCHL